MSMQEQADHQTAKQRDLHAQLAVIHDAAAFAPLSNRAFLRITGPDAARWLNGMVTNNIKDLTPGQGNYNFLLNAQGRIQGDCTIYREAGEEPAFLLETDATQVESIHQTLDRFIIMDDVELAPREDLAGILVAGPLAGSIVMALGTANHQASACDTAAPAPQGPGPNLKRTFYANKPVMLIYIPGLSVPQFEIWSDPSTTALILAELHASRAVAVSPNALEAQRILAGTPKYGKDIRNTETAKDLPQETGQTHALHFAKGCYLGQEIVERIRSRGQVHRTFTRFRLVGALPALPAKLDAGGKPAGELTSAVQIGDDIVALGYARREALDTHLTLTYPGGIANPQQPTT